MLNIVRTLSINQSMFLVQFSDQQTPPSLVLCPRHDSRSTACLGRRKQTLIARSVLELPPIIKHQDGALAFCHPCFRIGLPKTRALKPSNSKNSDANVLLLDLRCSYNTNGGERKRQRLQVRNALTVAPGVSRPPSETNILRGGVLFIQVRGRCVTLTS